MLRKAAALIIVVIIIVSAPAAVSAIEEGSWQAGAAAVSITPLEEHLGEDFYLGGYGFGKERGAAEGVRDDIWSRALALSDGEAVVVLAILDLPGISSADLDYIRREAQAQAGIPRENVLISVTHTHAGPDTQGLWGGVPSAYRDYLRRQAVQSIVEAAGSLQPARLEVAAADFAGGVSNRRGGDIIDPALHILRAVTPQGDAIAHLVIYGVHVTFLGMSNRLVSADVAGAVVEALEEQAGGTALFGAGVQGDQSLNRGELTMEEYGRAVAAAALEALREVPSGLPRSALELRRCEVDLAVRNPAFILAAALGYLKEYNVKFSLSRGLYVTVDVNYLRLGGAFSLVTVPGEALAGLGLEIKGMSDTSQTALLGLTNGTVGYLVHEDEWQGGIPFVNRGYEESVSMGKHAGPLIREQLRRLMEQ